MPDFNQYLLRHGEPALLAILDDLARRQNIRFDACTPLRQRWSYLIERETSTARSGVTLAA